MGIRENIENAEALIDQGLGSLKRFLLNHKKLITLIVIVYLGYRWLFDEE